MDNLSETTSRLVAFRFGIGLSFFSFVLPVAEIWSAGDSLPIRLTWETHTRKVRDRQAEVYRSSRAPGVKELSTPDRWRSRDCDRISDL